MQTSQQQHTVSKLTAIQTMDQRLGLSISLKWISRCDDHMANHATKAPRADCFQQIREQTIKLVCVNMLQNMRRHSIVTLLFILVDIIKGHQSVRISISTKYSIIGHFLYQIRSTLNFSLYYQSCLHLRSYVIYANNSCLT